MQNRKISFKILLTEFLASLFIVMISCLSFKAQELNKIDNLTLGLINGLAVAFLSYVCYSASGSHLNPTVSLSYYILSDKSLYKVTNYIGAQLLGSLCGSVLVFLLTPNEFQENFNALTYPH